MSRESVWYAIVALLGGTAIALAAATFPTSAPSDGPPVPGGGDGLGTFSIPVPEEPPANSVDLPASLLEFLGALIAAAAVVGLVAMAVYALSNWREVLGWIVRSTAIATALFLVFYLLMELPRGLFERGEFGIGDDSSRGGGNVVGGDSLVSTDPSWLVVVFVLFAGLTVAGLAALYGRDSVRDGSENAASSSARGTAAAVGRAAGRAADRLETARESENEIYRAWGQMAGLVDAPDPETTTTAEFADAAVEAGMRADDVRDLTLLFERVRYGTDEPTPDDEQRAVDLFRRIESTYTEEV